MKNKVSTRASSTLQQYTSYIVAVSLVDNKLLPVFHKNEPAIVDTMYCETALCLQTEKENGNFRSKQTCMQIIMIKCSTVSNIDRIKIQL
jgi:hypothetical protein